MPVVDDETVTAYAAARDLLALGDAYRATSRAHLLVLQRIGGRLDGRPGSEEELDAAGHVVRRAALAQETDAAFAIRGEQLRRRLLELRGLPVAP